MTTATRADLALAACQGLTDEELQERGAGSFQAMIERKRMYSKAAHTQSVVLKALQKKIGVMSKQLAELQQKHSEVLAAQIDAPVENTDQAAEALGKIISKKP